MSQYYECPKCGNGDFGDTISGGDMEMDGDWIWKEYTCKCGFEWREVYTFEKNETLDDCRELDDKGDVIK